MARPLQALMSRYDLKRRDVAQLLGKALNSSSGYSNSTVDSWLSGRTRVPAATLELLRLKLKSRKVARNVWPRLLHQVEAYSNQRELEKDLALALSDLKAGQLPDWRRFKAADSVRRAGYLLELTSHFGGPAYQAWRKKLLDQARDLKGKLPEASEGDTFLAGDRPRERLMDDLAADWGLAAGTDVRRFRQLARTGHV